MISAMRLSTLADGSHALEDLSGSASQGLVIGYLMSRMRWQQR